MAITLTTYSGQQMTPQDFAVLIDHLSGPANKLKLYGCSVSGSGSTLTVSDGWLLIKGRLCKVTSTSISVTLPASGSLYATCYAVVDLANTTAPATLTYSTSTSAYPSFADTANFNVVSGKAYQTLARFRVSTSGISGVANITSGSAGTDLASGIYVGESGLHIEWGSCTCSYQNPNVCKGTIKWRKAYTAAPIVITDIGQTENKPGDLTENSKTSDRTTTGCNVWIHRPAGDYGSTFKRGVLYIAIGY